MNRRQAEKLRLQTASRDSMGHTRSTGLQMYAESTPLLAPAARRMGMVGCSLCRHQQGLKSTQRLCHYAHLSVNATILLRIGL